MANQYPDKAGATKADGRRAIVKVIYGDVSADLMNNGAIPDGPQHSLIYTRIEQLSDRSIHNLSYDDFTNTPVANVIWAGK